MNYIISFLLLLVSLISIRLTDLFGTLLLVLLFSINIYRHNSLPRVNKVGYMLGSVMLFGLLATFFASWGDQSINNYQFFRSFGPLSLGLITFIYLSSLTSRIQVFSSLYFDALINGISLFFIFLALLRILGLLLGLQLMPGIYTSELFRVFPPLSSLLIPISLISWIKNQKISFISCLILLLFFQSKSNLSVLVVSFIIIAFLEYRQRSKPSPLIINKSVLLNLCILFILTLGAFFVFGSRYISFFNFGDENRVTSSLLAVSSLNSIVQYAFGIGHGIMHSEGFYFFTSSVSGRAILQENLSDQLYTLLINSQYDIENLPTYLLVRHGVIGFSLILVSFLSCFKSNIGRLMFFTYLLLNGLAGSIINTLAAPLLFSLYLYIDYIFYSTDTKISLN